MARDSCLARVTAGVAVGGGIGGAVGAVYGTYEAIRYKTSTSKFQFLKLRHRQNIFSQLELPRIIASSSPEVRDLNYICTVLYQQGKSSFSDHMTQFQ